MSLANKEIHHKDGDPTNNEVDNLELVTRYAPTPYDEAAESLLNKDWRSDDSHIIRDAYHLVAAKQEGYRRAKADDADLLAACKAVIGHFKQFTVSRNDMIYLAEKAIAKAEGRIVTTTNTQTLPTPWRIEKPGFPNGTYTVVVAADGSYVTSDGSPETKARIVHYANCYTEMLEAISLAKTFADHNADSKFYLLEYFALIEKIDAVLAMTGEQ